MAGTQLGLCWGTVPRASLLTLIDVAVDEGYTSISISPEQYAGASRTPGELRARLNNCGITIEAVDPALTWLPGLEARPGAGLLSYDVTELIEAAAAVGAPWVNAAAALPGPWSEAEITESFAKLCAQAADEGVGVLLEFVPWSTVGDLAAAARVVRNCGAANAGVTFDVWHFHRGGGQVADLRTEDLTLVRSIQLSDATAAPVSDPMTESISARELPGDGVIALTDLLPRVFEDAVTDVVSIEVFNTNLGRQPVLQTARLAIAAARSVLWEVT
jgi:sugar phosphate isomerase/epimerase